MSQISRFEMLLFSNESQIAREQDVKKQFRSLSELTFADSIIIELREAMLLASPGKSSKWL